MGKIDFLRLLKKYFRVKMTQRHWAFVMCPRAAISYLVKACTPGVKGLEHLLLAIGTCCRSGLDALYAINGAPKQLEYLLTAP